MAAQLLLLPDTAQKPIRDKAFLGQFFTPPRIALFMAGLFGNVTEPLHLLDPGAGQGVLSKAFRERFHDIQSVTLIERDPSLISGLQSSFCDMPNCNIINEDFIALGSRWVSAGMRPFSHVIMNPPYRKITSSSGERRDLRVAGIETVNLYSGFVALALSLLEPQGELVAIIPRSFCNGPYYRSFRRFIMHHAALRRIHLFSSRTSLFNSDKVLQENVIIHLERDGKQGDVTLSFSTDQTFSDMEICSHPIGSVVDISSEQCFINIPEKAQEVPSGTLNALPALPVNVSTGPVVDFRMREYLSKTPRQGDAPLLYPAHFNRGFSWPKPDFKKYNSIAVCAATMRWLYPNGWYVVARRLSSKEEKRRIVANVVDPSSFPGQKFLGFENHFNVFHNERKGLDENVARGLAIYLNSKEIDHAFRAFSGHTQVNATDLRSLPYPSLDELAAIGEESRMIPKERLEEWLTKRLTRS